MKKSPRNKDKHTSRHKQAYVELRHRILEGELEPQAPLSEYQLAAQLRVSRTPVREALKRLEHEGLVRFVHNHGAFVADFTVGDIVEIYQVREPLEALAAQIAAQEMSLAQANALERELDRVERLAADGQTDEVFQSDVHFHHEIIRCAGNKRLASILAILDDQMYRVRVLGSKKLPGHWKAKLSEHREILDNIKRRDCAGAHKAMSRHMRSSCETIVRSMMPRSNMNSVNSFDETRQKELNPFAKSDFSVSTPTHRQNAADRKVRHSAAHRRA